MLRFHSYKCDVRALLSKFKRNCTSITALQADQHILAQLLTIHSRNHEHPTKIAIRNFETYRAPEA